ncbi:hypothetical protein ACFE04_025700 [Oxalis oulophora]
MLSLSSISFISPQISTFQQLQPFHSVITSKPKIFKNPTKSPHFSRKNLTSTYTSLEDSSNFISVENPEADLTDIEPLSQSVDYQVLSLWLQSCRCERDVKRIHAVALKCVESLVVYLGNNLINGYVRFGKFIEARHLFDQMPDRNVVSWTAIINGYLKFGLDDEAFRLFGDSVENGIQPNENMVVCLLNLCIVRLDFKLGTQIHACVLKGNWQNVIVDSAVVDFYAKCGDLSDALLAFNYMPKRDVVSWTTMITACSHRGHGEDALFIFSKMLNNMLPPNEFTISSVLNACGDEKALRFGQQLHAAIVKKVYKFDIFIGTSLVDMYGKCGEISDARKLFNGMRYKNMVTWTSIIAGYARQGLGNDAISLFRVMIRRKMSVSDLTIVSILRACGSIGALLIGKEIHAQVIKNSNQSNLQIGTTLVWFYCKCGELLLAYKVFQEMPIKDVVSWTAMISGSNILGHEAEALGFLKGMMEEGVSPNSFTYSSALKACANLEAIMQGKLIHSFANKNFAMSNVFVGSALVHMYAKCGYIPEATQVFDNMPERTLVSWRAMVRGYARNGLCREAISLLYRMQAEGFEVDEYTRDTVFSACGGYMERNIEP